MGGPILSAKQRLLVALVIVVAGQSASAATITVRKDGTGDYTQVQPALDAAAEGDTVLIGPGEYTELIPSYIPGYAWDVDVCAYVRVSNLTIIGAGVGQTVLGPTIPQGSRITFSPKCMVWLDGNERHVSGITFRNCYDGIHVIDGPVFVDACAFVDNAGFGIVWQTNGSGGWVRDSQFSSSRLGSTGIGMLGFGSDVLVSNCIFDAADVYVQSVQNIRILSSEIRNSSVGLQLAAGARCIVDDCLIENCAVAGTVLSGVAPHCDILESTVSGGEAAVAVYADATVSAASTVFEGGSNSVFYFANAGPAEVHDCHLIRNGPYTINCNQPEGLPLVVHDFTMNYWGSTDPEVVAGWIKDQNDDPTNFSIVTYLPLADGPVATESVNWGSVKSMFR
jgi:hypothetical protein